MPKLVDKGRKALTLFQGMVICHREISSTAKLER